MPPSRAVGRKPAHKTPASKAARPSFPKSPGALVALFEAALQPFPQVQTRKVFGYPCAFVNGYMTAGLHGEDMFVRLAPDDQAPLLAMKGGGHLEVMPGRPMRDYVLVPPSVRAKKAELKRWIEKAVVQAGSLPRKMS